MTSKIVGAITHSALPTSHLKRSLQDEPNNGNHNVRNSEPDQTTNFVSIGQILDILSRERRLTSKLAIKGQSNKKLIYVAVLQKK
jgi:hypothetical protein